MTSCERSEDFLAMEAVDLAGSQKPTPAAKLGIDNGPFSPQSIGRAAAPRV